MSQQTDNAPWSVMLIQKLAEKCCPRAAIHRSLWHKVGILTLTYLAYTSYHLSRKPLSVVKNVLNQNCSTITPLNSGLLNATRRSNWCDWAPFDSDNAAALLGTLDSAFLFSYAVAMFFSGFIAERLNLRYFLALGMITSGIFSYLFGIAKPYNIHNIWYFIIVQVFSGIVQSTGWPGVVTVMGNWFGKGKRGVIFGVWNSHTSLGNILGSLISGHYVETDWSLSFIVPGVIIAVMGFIIFLFLVVSPEDVGCSPPDHHKLSENINGYQRLHNTHLPSISTSDGSSDTEDTEILLGSQDMVRHVHDEDIPVTHHSQMEKPIGFLGALQIPGVIEFSLSLFFAKLVSYTFLYWLPLYIKSSTTLSPTKSADLSTLFDVGGILGAIAAGVISDYSGMSATTCASMLLFATPMLFMYEAIGSDSLGINIVLLFVVGLLVNGPYALITTAVSAELGTHSSLDGNAKALATVTAIIDGTGSVGAAVGPLLAGFVATQGWQYVFYMLMTANALALILLLRLVKREIQTTRLSSLLCSAPS